MMTEASETYCPVETVVDNVNVVQSTQVTTFEQKKELVRYSEILVFSKTVAFMSALSTRKFRFYSHFMHMPE